jgi:splicing factor 1
METESGAKIAIRGKGSVKEGKGRSDAAHTSNQEEDLHCLIMADTEEKVNKAKKLIHNVIETVSTPLCLLNSSRNADTRQAASIPEGQNELKRNQLRELAALNGTLRDDENQACQNCRFPPQFQREKILTFIRWRDWPQEVRLPAAA